MKLSVMSDLHLEFEEQPQLSDSLRGIPVSEFYRQPPSTDADVLILAGDIHLGAGGVAWAHSRFRMPAVVIAGNHESYGGEWHDTVRRGRERAAATAGHVAFLERQVWVRRFEIGRASCRERV